MIPHQNVKNLMLNDEITKAVEAGMFNIYSIHTIDEGIEILTDIPAGAKDQKGQYPAGTIYNLVEKKLEEFSKDMDEESKKE
jgi:predicted ATP-dependent protease